MTDALTLSVRRLHAKRWTLGEIAGRHNLTVDEVKKILLTPPTESPSVSGDT